MMSEQNREKETSKHEEKKVNREMTAKEMEQVTGGAARINRPKISGIR